MVIIGQVGSCPSLNARNVFTKNCLASCIVLKSIIRLTINISWDNISFINCIRAGSHARSFFKCLILFIHGGTIKHPLRIITFPKLRQRLLCRRRKRIRSCSGWRSRGGRCWSGCGGSRSPRDWRSCRRRSRSPRCWSRSPRSGCGGGRRALTFSSARGILTRRSGARWSSARGGPVSNLRGNSHPLRRQNQLPIIRIEVSSISTQVAKG